jgi:hypothetical protein
MLMELIGLSGKKGSGKDTVCAIIKQEFPHLRVQRLAFADPLKMEVAGVLGVPVADVDAKKALFRGMLQWWGTEWRRGQNDLYWINQMHEMVEIARNLCDICVITDCRFKNEANYVREHGGKVFRVNRPALETCHRSAHASETALDDFLFDGIIWNSGDIDYLRGQVLTVDLGVARQPWQPREPVTPATTVTP